MEPRLSAIEVLRNAVAGLGGATLGGILANLHAKNTNNILSNTGKGALAGGIGGVGAYQLYKAITGGDLLGRELLYHSTTKQIHDKIKKNGFNPISKKNIGVTSRIPKKLRDASLGYSFFTNDLLKAKAYSLTTAARHIGNIDPRDTEYWKKTCDLIRNNQDVADNADIVTAFIPTWKYKTILNPEVNESLSSYIKDKASQKNKRTSENLSLIDGFLKREALADDRVIRGRIPTKYIEGSSNYKPYSIDDYKDYVENKPWAAGYGALKAALGIAAIAGAGKYFYDNLNKDN